MTKLELTLISIGRTSVAAASLLWGIPARDSLSCSLHVWPELHTRLRAPQSQVDSICHHLGCSLLPKNQTKDRHICLNTRIPNVLCCCLCKSIIHNTVNVTHWERNPMCSGGSALGSPFLCAYSPLWTTHESLMDQHKSSWNPLWSLRQVEDLVLRILINHCTVPLLHKTASFLYCHWIWIVFLFLK